MLSKQLLLLITLAFTVSFTNLNSNPTDLLKKTIFIYILFIILTKMHLQATIIAFILLTILFVLNGYKNYYENNDKDKNKIENIKFIKKILIYFIIAFLIINFGIYFLYQKNQYKNNFQISKFLFGTVKCDSLK